MSAQAGSASSRARRLRELVGFTNIGALYVLAVVIIVFSFWEPKLFPTYATFTEVLNGNAITALVALGLLFPLATGVFDLSVGYAFGFASVMIAWMLTNTSLPVWVSIVLTLLASALIGVVNGFVVVVLKIDSFISTLATGSLLQAGIIIITKNQGIFIDPAHAHGFGQLGLANWQQISLPVVYMVILAAVLWFFLQHTAYGRFAYATGLGPEAARLAGIRIGLMRFSALVTSSTIAGVAGICVSAVVSAGSPDVGPPYLIPAFASAFLGATQFKGGLFNAWGTVVAVLLLGTVITGLSLASVPNWTPYVFTGAVLILALGVSGLQRRNRVTQAAAPEPAPSEPAADRPADDRGPQLTPTT